MHKFIIITSLLTSLHEYVRLAINNNNSISDSNSNFGSYNAWVRGVSVSSCTEQKTCSLQLRRAIYHGNVIMSTQPSFYHICSWIMALNGLQYKNCLAHYLKDTHQKLLIKIILQFPFKILDLDYFYLQLSCLIADWMMISPAHTAPATIKGQPNKQTMLQINRSI